MELLLAPRGIEPLISPTDKRLIPTSLAKGRTGPIYPLGVTGRSTGTHLLARYGYGAVYPYFSRPGTYALADLCISLAGGCSGCIHPSAFAGAISSPHDTGTLISPLSLPASHSATGRAQTVSRSRPTRVLMRLMATPFEREVAGGLGP